ncbi:MAG: tRNA (N6-isopentenyl adenosine(37)-C2)-methylthiotransferase MiaB [Clostridia bacterium]|nr:tRNA (N6-isopentenyl adenosine(37)-C2)-methylthiotransferase MiaB [Clostridia bacterium]
MPQKYHLETFGCQMNERDTEILAGMLEELGYQPTENERDADIIILNTCCVRETAENKVWGRIGELTHTKSRNPEVILGICGCMTQQVEVAEKIRQKAPHMDLIFGTHNIHQLPDLIQRVKTSKKAVLEVWEREGEIVENLPTRREDGLKAFITIMYGCNNFCTYCIVPYVRGRERSRLIPDIKAEITQLAREGYKEITLLGQNVNSYGKDLEPRVEFADLLWELNKIGDIYRLRFTSSHPKDLSDRLIEAMAGAEKVCEHIHLPVQAGSNRVLKAMNRNYTREHYLELIHKLREAVPQIAITTDLIVGFPGETDQDFRDTMDLLERVRYDAAYTFVYNKRSGTPAADLADQVPDEVKKARIQELITLQNSISLAKNREEIGQRVEVLVEGPSKTNESKLTGRTRSNKVVVFTGNPDLKGKLATVSIDDAKTWHLEGKLI